jgi:hypothetical protein
MRMIATRTLASVLSALLASSCGTVRESRQPDIEERVFLPRAPRAVASPVLEELELRRAIEELLPYVNVEEVRAELRRMAADPRFHGRQPGELRVVLASWGSGPVALDEIGREYRAWCAAVRRANCHEGPLTDSSIYEIAFDFAMGSQWDGFVGEVKSTIDPSTIRIVLLTGLVIFMATIAIPELLSKIPAAAATVVLTAYLGARAVCDLVFGWIQMVRELDAATTFNEVRSAGERYGRLVGAQTARVLILLATAAIAQGGLIARLMKLPRATQASAALAAESGGVTLEAVGAVKGAQVLQGGVAITVEGAAAGAVAVAMAAHGAPPPSGAAQKFEVRKYKDMPNPTPVGTEAHHGVLDAWMRRHFLKYRTGEAPAILMSARMHNAMRTVYNRWRIAMTERMGGKFDWGRVSEVEIRNLSERMFDGANVPNNVRRQFWEQFEKYRASLSN